MASLDSQPLGPSKTVFASSYPRHVTVERQQFTPIDRHVGTNRCVLPWAFLYGTTLHPEPLRAALAQTLNQFPSLAGRVQPITARSRRCWQLPATTTATLAHKHDWQLLLCNAGVPFSICSSSWSLQDIISSNCMTSRSGFIFPDNSTKSSLPTYMEPLDPVKVLTGDAPLLTIRLTQLAGGGSILALMASHIVLDGRSYVAFLQHWANLYNKLVSPACTATADINDTASAAAALEGIGDSNKFQPSKKLLNDIALGTHTSTTVSPRTAVTTPSAVTSYRNTDVSNTPTAQPVLHGAAEPHNVSQAADVVNPKPAGETVHPVLQPGIGPLGAASVHDSYESVTASKVTHLTRAASQQPSSTTAEAPDDVSLQLSISISSTASTVMSTWSAAGCKDNGHAVTASLGAHPSRHCSDGDTYGAASLTPVASEEALGAAVAGNSAAALAPSALVGNVSVCQDSNRHVDQHHQQQLLQEQRSEHAQQPQSATGRPSVKPFTYTPDPLYATRVPASGWLPAFRTISAAYKQIKSEEAYVNRAILEGIMPTPATAAAVAGGAAKTRGGAKAPAQNMSDLSTKLLHIPAAAVQRVKATASAHCSEGQYISSNDVVSALVWVLMCYLRRRPLPGQPRTTDMQDSLFGVALDLRTAAVPAHTSAPSSLDAVSNSHQQQQQQQPASAVPLNYFGNAAWSVSVRSCNKDGVPGDDSKTTLPVGWHKRINPKEWQMVCSDQSLLSTFLAAGAMRIRGALQAVRQDTNFTTKVLQQIDEGIAAPLSSQVTNTAGFVKAIDGFTTSWQFGMWDIAFGSQGAVMFQGLVHPVPPYHAVIMPSSSVAPTAAVAGQDDDLHSNPQADVSCLADDVSLTARVTLVADGNSSTEAVDNADVVAAVQEAAGNDAGGDAAQHAVESSSGGVWLWLTVPSCLVPAMAESPVLKMLVPDASWQSL